MTRERSRQPSLTCTEKLVEVFDDGLCLDGIIEFAEEPEGGRRLPEHETCRCCRAR